MIKVNHFTKYYDKNLAVDDLSFEVGGGAILGMVGQNGAGKTSTLRAIAGVIPPTEGEIFVCGHEVTSDPLQAKKCLAYIPDEPRLFEALTVWEHLQFYGAAYQVNQWETGAEQLLHDFELFSKKNVTARELSRGMRQKVAICCGFLYEPQAILFDEPHTGLDPQGIRTMKAAIERRAQAGAACIVSSHLLSLIEGICTHLLILSSGRCQFFGTLQELRQKHPELGDDHSLEEIFFRETNRTFTSPE